METPIEEEKKPGSFLDAAFAPKTVATMNAAAQPYVDAMTAQAQPGSPPVAPEVAAPVAAPPPAEITDPYSEPKPQTVSTSESRTQTQSGTPINAALQSQIQDSRAEQANAQANVAAIEADSQKKQAKIEEEKAKALETQRLINENAAEKRQLAADAEMQKIRDAQKELDAVKEPEQDGVGTRIGKAIALALGAFGAGLTGGPNRAMEVIEADRAAKMQAWKAQYARAQGKVAGTQNLYALLRNKGMDDATAEAATLQNLNEGYANKVRVVAAGTKALSTIEQAKATEEALKQQNLAHDNTLWENSKAKSVKIVDDKSKTAAGADIKDKKDLIELASKDEHIKRYNETNRALTRFQDLVKSGADGAALADFIAGKGGLEQGSFGPNFVSMMKKRGVFGAGLEQLRSAWSGGVDPGIIKDISNGLAAEKFSTRQRAGKSLNYYGGQFRRAGIDPGIIVGGETSTEAAESAGAAPSAYQGKR